jgi:hypothetical protein
LSVDRFGRPHIRGTAERCLGKVAASQKPSRDTKTHVDLLDLSEGAGFIEP